MTSSKLLATGLLLLLLLCVDSAAAAADDDAAIRASVVKIVTTQRGPDFYRPWTKAETADSGGTGFVIDGNRILTNAHVVWYANQIYVQPHQSPDKLRANAVAISNAMDLAILRLDDETFFANHPPLSLQDGLPRVKASVNVYGYPIGGSELSITEGITSRVEYTDYYYDTDGLSIQIDAAINPGNSGGPAVSNGKVVGVAFRGLSEAENIGYLIPADEVRMFLTDIDDGRYDGKPRLLDSFAPADNEAIRSALKLIKEVGGCVLTRVKSPDPSYPLKERDVITHIGPHAIDRNGQVLVEGSLQVPFTYFVPLLAKNHKVPLTVHRAGESLTIDVPVTSHVPRVASYLDGHYPEYFIVGPLVLSKASSELVMHVCSSEEWLYDLRRSSPLVARFADPPRYDGEELVVVPAPLFAHPLTKGYASPILRVVERINGVPVKNLVHAVELMRDSTGEFLEFTFAEADHTILVFPRQAMLDSTESILDENGIRNQCSPNLVDVWKK